MQPAYDLAQARKRETEIRVERYQPYPSGEPIFGG